LTCIFFSLNEREENIGSHQFFELVTADVHRTSACKWVQVPTWIKNKGHPFGCPLFWCARRDLNSSLVEYMVFLKLLFAQNACFVSNIPIFPTMFFTLILLRVLVRVKIRVTFWLLIKAPHGHKVREELLFTYK